MLGALDGGASLWLELEAGRSRGKLRAITEAGAVELEVEVEISSAGTAGASSVDTATAAAAAALGLPAGSLEIRVTGAAELPDAAAGHLAAAAIAVLLRTPIDQDAAILGAPLPDGTLLLRRVSPQLIAAAAAAGVRRLGLPMGMRHSSPADGGARIDLVELAAANGIAGAEVADVAAAYRFLTGVALPRTLPAAADAMAIEGPLERELVAAYGRWRLRLAPDWARVLEGGEAMFSDRLRRRVRRTDRLIAAAEVESTRGMAATALHRIERAYALAHATARAHRARPSAAWTEAGSEIELVAVESRDRLAALAGQRPISVGESLGVIVAARRALAAAVVAEWARERASELAADAEIGAAEASAALEVLDAVAGARAQLAELADPRVIDSDWGPRRPAASADIGTAAAREADRATGALSARDSRTSSLIARARVTRGAALGDALVALAAGREARRRAELRVARERLGVVTHPVTGEPVEIAHPAAIGALLDHAEQWVRRRAGAAKIATGAIPASVRVDYQAARGLREGSLPDKLEALALYWSAGSDCDLAIALARPPTPE